VSVPDSEQYMRMLDAAAEGGYAYPSVKVTSTETLNAALRGFAEAVGPHAELMAIFNAGEQRPWPGAE
jgi:fructose/tagatose bisphosphate aldolase